MVMLKTPTKRVKGHPLQPCPLGIGFPLFQNHSKAEWDQFAHVLDLAGGFNPFEKYYSNWIISPGRDKKKKMFETITQRLCLGSSPIFFLHLIRHSGALLLIGILPSSAPVANLTVRWMVEAPWDWNIYLDLT